MDLGTRLPDGRLDHKCSNFHKNAARERGRVKSLRMAFQRLQNSLPWVPSDTKLSKLDILQLAIYHIQNLMKILDSKDTANLIKVGDDRVLHPLKQIYPIEMAYEISPFRWFL
ncbi:transcription factor 24-like isoform X2 [Brevipalpus obovatus]|uniref:transcription factor 24-like isoform X2 n=1 Tax=Brevipalpus obovatus TaxID=246614 RepID=UPI003D9E4019